MGGSIAAGVNNSVAHAAAAGLVLFGACRALSGVAKELQGPVFAPVSQVRFWRFPALLYLSLGSVAYLSRAHCCSC